MKIHHKKSFTRIGVVLALLSISMWQIIPLANVSAAQITSRSLTLKAGTIPTTNTTDAGSMAGGVVSHYFKFTVPGTGNVNSIKFLYCTDADPNGACITPTGLSTTGATLTHEQGATGFTMNSATQGAPYITRSGGAPINADVEYQLSGITNPTTENQTFFVRISTYETTDATGTAQDLGTVAASTTRQIVLSGTMPESLVFCTGSTIGTTGGVPDCAKAGVGAIAFNQLFSPTDTATSTSQMAASTNATSGYSITVNGPSLTSGSNTITPLPAPVGITRGLSQFGINLKANTIATSDPVVGTEIEHMSELLPNYLAQPDPDYGTADSFMYLNGDVVATSSAGSDAQIMTVSYIVNVPGSQPAGTYTTTLTYICTPTF